MEYGCIGRKLGHSFSKIIHEKLYPCNYILKELEPDNLDAFLTKRDFKAINVTIPYKQAVIPHLFWISDEAKKIGAVNTIVNRNGLLYGYNTDFSGMCLLIKETGVDIKDKKVAILGSGGTSKTAFAVSNSLGAKEVLRVSRNANDGAITYAELYNHHSDADIIINTTPVGMYPENDGLSADITKFPNLSGVIDAIYNPLNTRLVNAAKSRKIPASCGLLMLVAQAVYAAEHFLSRKFENEDLYRVYNEILETKTNTVLIGMPASGKSTVGRYIAQKTNREFIDTDKEITKRFKKTPAEIINQNGEQAFRDIESEVISDIAKKNGIVIATGGGAILKEENVCRLKQNGKLFFIDRKLSDIAKFSKSENRPLSDTEDKLKALYEKRLPIYKHCADATVYGNSVEEIGECILKWNR